MEMEEIRNALGNSDHGRKEAESQLNESKVPQ